MRFIVDAQLPPALARWLRAAGHESEHVEDCGLRDASDEAIWAHALATGGIILTKDEDFPARATQEAPASAPVIVWLRLGNATNPALHAWFEPRLPAILQLLEQGERLIQVI